MADQQKTTNPFHIILYSGDGNGWVGTFKEPVTVYSPAIVCFVSAETPTRVSIASFT